MNNPMIGLEFRFLEHPGWMPELAIRMTELDALVIMRWPRRLFQLVDEQKNRLRYRLPIWSHILEHFPAILRHTPIQLSAKQTVDDALWRTFTTKVPEDIKVVFHEQGTVYEPLDLWGHITYEETDLIPIVRGRLLVWESEEEERQRKEEFEREKKESEEAAAQAEEQSEEDEEEEKPSGPSTQKLAAAPQERSASTARRSTRTQLKKDEGTQEREIASTSDKKVTVLVSPRIKIPPIPRIVKKSQADEATSSSKSKPKVKSARGSAKPKNEDDDDNDGEDKSHLHRINGRPPYSEVEMRKCGECFWFNHECTFERQVKRQHPKPRCDRCANSGHICSYPAFKDGKLLVPLAKSRGGSRAGPRDAAAVDAADRLFFQQQAQQQSQGNSGKTNEQLQREVVELRQRQEEMEKATSQQEKTIHRLEREVELLMGILKKSEESEVPNPLREESIRPALLPKTKKPKAKPAPLPARKEVPKSPPEVPKPPEVHAPPPELPESPEAPQPPPEAFQPPPEAPAGGSSKKKRKHRERDSSTESSTEDSSTDSSSDSSRRSRRRHRKHRSKRHHGSHKKKHRRHR